MKVNFYLGHIINEIRADRNYRVYADQKYNRYTYMGFNFTQLFVRLFRHSYS